MSAGKRTFAVRWFGWNRREVSSYLNKLEAMQRSEADELEDALRAQRHLNEQLQAKLAAGRRKAAIEPMPADKAALLLERLERSIEAIERQGQAETDSLRRLRDRKMDQHHRKLADLEKQLDEYRRALDFLLGEADELIVKVKEKEEAKPPHELEREAEQAMQIVPEKVSSTEQVEEEEAQEAARETETFANAKILQFKLRSILNETAAAEEKELREPAAMTADGMTLEKREDAPAREPQDKPKNKKPRSEASGFWGDLDDYMDAGEDVEAPSAWTITDEESVVPANDASNGAAAGSLQEADRRTPAAASQAPEDSAPAAESVPSAASPALAGEIQSIQNRYIVGKISGENLHTADGRLIIAKGQVITGETVQAAEREGKLPELIVNMVIPGFGAEEA